MKKNEILAFLQELVDEQKQKVLSYGREIIPHLTMDDVLQPNDYEELEYNPIFRYEEGILCGFQSALVALQTHFKNNE